MNPIKSYLAMPDLCPARPGGVRWANADNSLETADGHFAFAEEIAEFLEGFAHARRILHFALIVHFLRLLRQEPDASVPADSQRRRLRRLFIRARGALQSAGAFCGQLCRDIPAAREANKVAQICRRLRAREPLAALLGEEMHPRDFIQVVGLGYEPPELPPLDVSTFEAKVMEALKTYDDAEVIYWLTHGRAPLDKTAAKTVAEAVPPTLAGRLASLLTRTRLARARAWVTELQGALALPPRRLTKQQLPLGGYSDVTTHGNVDQILPSQFALDEWDFFRRYAERELLYFRREDPRDPTRQELVVLLDQGVRTWGDVRLVLGAALVALGKQALTRGDPFLVATTAVDVIDPLQVDEDAIGEMIEASDLSPHPGLALERMLERPSHKDRDFVLLTHPRNLNEQDVRAAARRLRPADRLFALSLDRHGEAALCEFKHGVPIAIRQFRVDYSRVPAEAAAAPPQAPRRWTGDVEPIGFPFHFGVGGKIGASSFDFDLECNHLLTAGPKGMLHLWDTAGTLNEILPRPMWKGEVIDWSTPHVVGIAGGFLVIGVYGRQKLAAHFDLETCKCTCHVLTNQFTHLNRYYSPAHHCLIVPFGGALALDLGSGERFAPNLGGPKCRAQDAWIAWERGQVPLRELPIANTAQAIGPKVRSIYLDPDSGKISFAADALGQFTPQADGQPMLRKRLALSAQLGGCTLALLTSPLGNARDIRQHYLHLFRWTDGVPLGDYPMSAAPLGFRLSADGTLLARQLGDGKIEISPVAGNLASAGRTATGGYTQALPFVLGRGRLLLSPGRHLFLLDWWSGKLKFSYDPRQATPTLTMPTLEQGVKANAESVPGPCCYDRDRWHLGAANGGLLAASDRYGQLAVFDRHQRLICMFFAFRTRLAGWMPDGAAFSQGTTAGEELTNRFGAALRAATST